MKKIRERVRRAAKRRRKSSLLQVRRKTQDGVSYVLRYPKPRRIRPYRPNPDAQVGAPFISALNCGGAI